MGLRRRFNGNSESLAQFRVRADVDYDRSLSKLIQSEIIPRLMVAHAPASSIPRPAETDLTFVAADVEALAMLVLQVEADELLTHIEGHLARGAGIETVMVDLLAPAARLLGEYWEDDRCDFVDVTMGLWRLQEVVHEIATRSPDGGLEPAVGCRALFASMPGDQHSFGALVVDEVFRRGGWVTARLSEADTDELVGRVGSDWFDMIGLTVNCDYHIAPLPSLIAALRCGSRNPRVSIMVGGRMFGTDPDLADQVGADGTASDAKLALIVAADLVRARKAEVVDFT
ncbi:B12-binding domain-containing protein [Sphingomonas antarctica]|uniref:cobalamin B12-binding domain-containing protein n=1 Tax=Sphingomonas antarctica TaxID=2040274 RepID=UPI0039ECADDF